MQDLEPPDSHHWSAAVGWIELGNASEALSELGRISAAGRARPEVMDIHWRILAQMKDWPAALQVAERMIEAAPDDSAGWINKSFALHEMKRTQEAWDQLQPASRKFPDVAIIFYNLACYACQLGWQDDAKELLNRAILLRSKGEIKLMAKRDADLEPLRAYIEDL